MHAWRGVVHIIQTFVSEHFAYLGFLLLAIFIWFLMQMSEVFLVTEHFDIVYQVDSSLLIDTEPIEDMTVKLSAKGWDLLNLYLGNFKKQITISPRARTGAQDLGQADLHNAIKVQIKDPRVQIQQIIPAQIPLVLIRKAQKKIPISLQGTINAAVGYTLKVPLRYTPDSLTVQGSLADIQNIQTWLTQSFNYKNLKDSLVIEIPLRLAPTGISLSDQAIKLTAFFEQTTNKKMVIDISQLDPNLVLIPSQVEVEIEVGLSKYQHIKPEDFLFQLKVDTSRTPENLIAPLILKNHPSGLKQINYTPKAVKYIYQTKQY